MTPEQAEKLAELLELYEKTDKVVAIIIACWLVVMIMYGILELLKFLKIRQWRKEYELTLTEEQRKILKQYKDLVK